MSAEKDIRRLWPIPFQFAQARTRPDPTRNGREAVSSLIHAADDQSAFFRYVESTINWSEFERIAAQHAGEPVSPSGMKKYLDIARYLPKVYQRALACSLNTSKGLKILDLGCGLGYFSLAARYFQHDVTGLDLPDQTLIDSMTRLLGLRKISHRIDHLTPLPPISGLHLITAFNAQFLRMEYGPKEWTFFLEDALSRLTRRGRLYLHMNDMTGFGMDVQGAEFAALLSSFGGTLNGRVIEVRKHRT